MMGSPDSEAERDNGEGPQRQVTVLSFFIGAFAITQRQYQEIMGKNPSQFIQDGADRPVESVKWLEAEAFCQKLRELTGNDYHLPSEAEWEYACRAGTTTPFAFGETLTTKIANYDGEGTYGAGPEGDYRGTTVPVDTFSPNAFGLYNTHGNVMEWCADDMPTSYPNAPENAPDSTSEQVPDVFDDLPPLKVVRGGSWFAFPHSCRSAYRSGALPDHEAEPTIAGFRVSCGLRT